MPHGWRLPARSAASPRACATDASPIPGALAGAFVDRTPIDWTAVLERVRDPRDRAPLEALRRLDALRGRQETGALPPGRTLPVVLLRVLVAVAAVQTIAAFAQAAVVVWRGGSIAPATPYLLLAAAFAAASLLLATAAARDRRVLPLFATFTLAASAFARPALIGLAGAAATMGVPFRGLCPEAFVPAALWQFALLFPAVPRFTRFDVRARRMAAAAWALSSGLFLANLADAYGWLPRPLQVVGRDDPGNLFWHLFAVATLPAFAAIFVRAHRAPPPEREKAVRLGCALGAGAAPLLLSGVLRMALPGVDRWMVTAAGPARLAADVAIAGALAAMPVLATLAVIVDRPFDLHSIVPARLRRRLAGSGLNVSGVAQTGSLRPLRRREWLTAALDRVRLARAPREIAAVVCRELQFGVGARTSAVLPIDELPRESALLAILEDTPAPIGLARDAEPFMLLPAPERAWLTARDVMLAAPLRTRDGAMAAVALIGPRRSGAAYDRVDRWFIATLLSGAAAAWDAQESRDAFGNAAMECARCGVVSATTPLPCRCDGAPIAAALPPRLAGKFDVTQRLGAGGTGVVYLARDTALGRDVALKTLPALRDGSVERLRDEARAMAALNHPSLATIYGLDVWRRTPVLVVEHLAGGTLAARLAHGPLAAADVVALGIRLLDALAYMHDRGLLHRDVKPANIGFTADGAAKLLDFGLSAAVGPPAGTPGYLPPEALAGAAPDTAVDLWGAATVLAQAAGRDGGGLAPFFARALAPAPADRFASAAGMRDALLRLQR